MSHCPHHVGVNRLRGQPPQLLGLGRGIRADKAPASRAGFSSPARARAVRWRAVPGLYLLGAEFLQKTDQIVSMLFFHGENPFHQPPGRGVLVAKVIDHITVAIDGDALGDQVFFNNVEQPWD